MAQKEGKCCLVFTNVLLCLLGLLVAGVAAYIKFGGSIPIPEIESLLTPYITLLIIVGIVILIVGLLGWCASAGGCWLWIYSTLIFICFVVGLAITVLVFILVFIIKSGSSLQETVMNAVAEAVSRLIEADEKNWIAVEELFKCCGYEGVNTSYIGDICNSANETMANCKDVLFSYASTYLIWIGLVFVVIEIVLLILVCSSCKLCCAKDQQNIDF